MSATEHEPVDWTDFPDDGREDERHFADDGPIARSAAIPPDERDKVEPLDRLLAERRSLAGEYAKLAGLYGPFGTWDAVRKSMLEALKLRALSPLADDPPAPAKTTDTMIDAWAHAHPAYSVFIAESTSEKQRFVALDMQLTDIKDRIRRSESVLYLLAAECRFGG